MGLIVLYLQRAHFSYIYASNSESKTAKGRRRTEVSVFLQSAGSVRRRSRPSMADYYSVIARAVSRLPSTTDEARHAIYERARNPPFSETELATEQAALEVAISMVEVVSDLRRGAETV